MNRIKHIGLTQAEAAEIIGCSRDAVIKAEHGRPGPVTGALDYLAATWPLLTDEQRDQVRAHIREMREMRQT